MSRGRCATKELCSHLVNASVVIKDLIVSVKAKDKPSLFPTANYIRENDVGFPTVIYTETGKLV